MNFSKKSFFDRRTGVAPVSNFNGPALVNGRVVREPQHIMMKFFGMETGATPVLRLLHPILRLVLAGFPGGELACAGHGVALNSAIDA